MVTMQIWTNRLVKEFDGIETRLPKGVVLSSHIMHPEEGVCRAVFDALVEVSPVAGVELSVKDAIPEGDETMADEEQGEKADGDKDGGNGVAGDGTAEPDLIKGTEDEDGAKEVTGGDVSETTSSTARGEGKLDGEPQHEPVHEASADDSESKAAGVANDSPLAFKIEMDMGLEKRYPFEAPIIRVVEGSSVIPSSVLAGDVIVLPDGDSWTPSNTIVATLQDICDMVLHAREARLPTGERDGVGALERGELRAGSLVPIEVLGGNVFPCSPPPVPLFSGSLMSPLTRRPLDRYVGVTDRQVLELEAHRTRMNHTVVVSAVDMKSLVKLKFKRGSSVTLVLRDGDSKEFLMTQSHECVRTVTDCLERMGIAGHQTTAGAERQVELAKSIMTSIQNKERELEEDPSIDLVKQCMDLFRQAAELFSAADDRRHEQVLGHMHSFLQQPTVVAVLESNPNIDPIAATEAAEQPSGISTEIDVGPAMQEEGASPSETRGIAGDDDDGGVGQEEPRPAEGDEDIAELEKMLDTPAVSATATATATATTTTSTEGGEADARSSSSIPPAKSVAKEKSAPVSGGKPASKSMDAAKRESKRVASAKPVRETRLSAVARRALSPDNPKLKKSAASPTESRLSTGSRVSSARKPRTMTSTVTASGSVDKAQPKVVAGKSSADASSSTARKEPGSEARSSRVGGAARGEQARTMAQGRGRTTRGAARTARAVSTRGAKTGGTS